MQILHLPFALHWPPKHELKHIKSGMRGCQQQPLQHKAGVPMLSFHAPCWDMRLMVSFSQSSGTGSPAVGCGTKTHMIFFFFLVKWSRKLSQLSKYFSHILPNHTPKTLTNHLQRMLAVVFIVIQLWVVSQSSCAQELQHTGLPCPSVFPRFCSNSCPLSRWCHQTISSSVAPFLLLPSIFPSIRVFSHESALCIGWPKYWSFSLTPIRPVNIQGCFL